VSLRNRKDRKGRIEGEREGRGKSWKEKEKEVIGGKGGRG